MTMIRRVFRRFLLSCVKLACALFPAAVLERLLPYDWKRIQKSYQPLRSRSQEYSQAFYENFWADYPETRPLFGKNMPKSELDTRINHFMVFMVENAGNPKAFVQYLDHLARRHQK